MCNCRRPMHPLLCTGNLLAYPLLCSVRESQRKPWSSQNRGTKNSSCRYMQERTSTLYWQDGQLHLLGKKRLTMYIDDNHTNQNLVNSVTLLRLSGTSPYLLE
ncbi:unnamed protein product [Ectocarpus sp. 12 AP-2014]